MNTNSFIVIVTVSTMIFMAVMTNVITSHFSPDHGVLAGLGLLMLAWVPSTLATTAGCFIILMKQNARFIISNKASQVLANLATVAAYVPLLAVLYTQGWVSTPLWYWSVGAFALTLIQVVGTTIWLIKANTHRPSEGWKSSVLKQH